MKMLSNLESPRPTNGGAVREHGGSSVAELTESMQISGLISKQLVLVISIEL